MPNILNTMNTPSTLTIQLAVIKLLAVNGLGSGSSFQKGEGLSVGINNYSTTGSSR